MECDRILLKKIARQLEVWAKDSVVGGWSTHQVDPMRKLASEIFTHLGRSSSQQSNAADGEGRGDFDGEDFEVYYEDI